MKPFRPNRWNGNAGRPPRPPEPLTPVIVATFDRASLIVEITALGLALQTPALNPSLAESIKVILDAFIDMALNAPPHFMSPPLDQEVIDLWMKWKNANVLPLE